jgi:serine palmitoyltransferase
MATAHVVHTHLHRFSALHLQATAMSPLAAEQTLAALQLINCHDGTTRGPDKIARLRFNSNYFRSGLLRLGFQVLGDWDSPIMPIMLYLPGALLNFSQFCLEQHVAVVVVGFPATALLAARARICISAAHTREDLDYCLGVFKDVGERTGCLYQPQVPHKLLTALEDWDRKLVGGKAAKVADASLDVAAVMRGSL